MIRRNIGFLVLLIVICCAFFYKTIFFGQIPFPGDLLVNEKPYETESYLGYAPGGYPHKAQGQDVISEIYPWRYFSINELKKGNMPFWNPHNFSGNPQLANFQTGIFYPLNILYFVFVFNFAWSLIIILQPILAGIFMYLFLLKALLLKRFPAFLGAISFALSSYMVVWLEYGNIGHTILWLPAALWFTKRLYQKISIFNFATLVTLLTFSFLAGYIQGFFYIYVLCFLYFLFLMRFGKTKPKKIKSFFVFFSALLLPFLIANFQFIATYKLFAYSTREAYSLSQISNILLPLKYWVTIFASDFFGNPATRNYWIVGTYIERVMYPGVAILFFAFYALARAKNIERFFFSSIALLSLIITTNLPGVKLLYDIPIPVISTTVPTRELSILIFSVIVLAAMGIDYWISNKENKTKVTVLFALIYVFIWLFVLFVPKVFSIDSSNIKITIRNLILPSFFAFLTIVIFYTKRRYKFLSLVLLTLIVVADLFYFFNKITPFSPKELIYPKTPVVSFLQKEAGINRFWGYGSAYIRPNFQSFDGTYSPEGNDPLHLSSYGELLYSTANGAVSIHLPRPDANIAPGFGSSDLKSNFYRKRILNLLGVKYILNINDSLEEKYKPDFETFPESSYKLIWQASPWQIYENLEVLPRFFMASSYMVVKDKKSILSKIYDKNVDLRKTIILEKNPSLTINNDAKGNAELLSYGINSVKFKTTSNGNNLLFLSDNFYPGWKANIDGKYSEVYRGDYTFKAVAVPKGEHEVILFHSTPIFHLGLKISIFGILFFLGMILWIRIYGKKI